MPLTSPVPRFVFILLCHFLLAGNSSAQVLFRDDFNGTALDPAKWSLGTWTLGRTQLGNAPVVSGGLARLKFDTFNPADPGRSFLGAEIGTKAVFARGLGIEFEARVRVNSLPSGQLIRTATTAVPDEPTNIRLNFWAPLSGWSEAYSNKFTPAKNARQNQTFYYDVDYVEVRTIP